MYKLLIVFIIIAVGFGFLFFHNKTTPESTEKNVISAVTYQCDNNHIITATFYEGAVVEVAPGEMPVPTGSVDIALDGGATSTFEQTISADGVRYADADETFVFWTKGSEALVMRGNEMDLTYRNCHDSTVPRQDTDDTATEEFPYQYVSTDTWPPVVEPVGGEYTCSEGEEKTINGTPYCVTEASEGAAGSTYVTYTYFGGGERTEFTLRFPQCLNYDQPEQDVCLEEQEALDVDALISGFLTPVS